MNMSDYDVVTIGGGLGGAALAKAMAETGCRVLVLERAKEFKDRVRGEVLVPWGCVEARRLGIHDALRSIGGHDLTHWAAEVDGTKFMHRDLVATSPAGLPVMTFFHPDMQGAVLRAAIDAGAEVRRGTRVLGVKPGARPTVTFEHGGRNHEIAARLVAAADGRGSAARTWGGFPVRSDPQRRFFAGVLFENLPAPEDTLYSRFLPSEGLMSWLFPQGKGRVRAYVGYHAASAFPRLQGEADVARFIETSIRIGVPADYFAGARVAGPLATFDATDNWVEHPYRDGIALIGDAAATSDPTWGQGMSITARGVRILSENLKSSEDWDAAAHAYADSHDRGYSTCRTCDNWYTDLLLEIGPQADALRAQALPRLIEDLSRMPDTPISGLEVALADDRTRRRFFGEE
jgi:2-polyprenyl-6-methoxyphenol hydroxylase-like FAD-dependent oxidoreductase